MIELHELEPLKKFDLVYVATPYSKYPAGMERAFAKAARIAGRLIEKGIKVYCPIAHSHPIASYAYMDPLDYGIWLPLNDAIMNRCDALAVVLMETWELSFGIGYEVDFFDKLGKPVFALDPGIVDERP